jgi:hypothetical protein
VHLRAPSTAPGSQALGWATAFGVYSWLLMEGIGGSTAMSVVVGALVFAGSFFLVRVYGEDLTRKRRSRRSSS